MSDKIDVLDHGYVRLIGSMGGDLAVVRAARVSHDADWRAGEDEGDDARLIRYLMRNGHTSPFEHVQFTFEVKAPLFVLRQWMRHRTWCLAGDTALEFVRPCDARPYKVRLDRLERSWNPKAATRRRRDQSPMSLAEWNRSRIGGMGLRCRDADGSMSLTRVTDVWKSGRKPMFEVHAGGKAIKASADHLFFSEGEWTPVSRLAGRSVTLLGRGGRRIPQEAPSFSDAELSGETWAEFQAGYRVSSLGRVETQWGQGAKCRRDSWMPKAVTTNRAGRAVVSVGGRVVQVSRLVAAAFVPGDGECVRHLNDNALDNRACNLKWGAIAENHADSVANGSRAVLAWREHKVDGIVPVGEMDCFDVTVEHPEHNFVASNFLVHNCFNEVSMRYSEVDDPQFYVPRPGHVGVQSASSKQARVVDGSRRPVAEIDEYARACRTAAGVYRDLLSKGWPRELARCVLPMSAYSRMFATVDLHNLFHFLKLRLHPHAQYEIRVYAEAILQLIRPIAPVCVAAWEESNGVRS